MLQGAPKLEIVPLLNNEDPLPKIETAVPPDVETETPSLIVMLQFACPKSLTVSAVSVETTIGHVACATAVCIEIEPVSVTKNRAFKKRFTCCNFQHPCSASCTNLYCNVA